MTLKKILNIGCGKTRIPGSIGMDQVIIPDFTDVIHNLNTIPYPFGSDSVDEVHFYHVLEHLNDPIKILEEINRILKPGGIIHMRVPHFRVMALLPTLLINAHFHTSASISLMSTHIITSTAIADFIF